ncbi:MAG: FtsQ-type POTRA domain-containing protein [Candidatus Omnitrophica bacterium]|nr:FtsQ-type POTRA domain-containing protein [Candidatus Omnitrophota bacterium]
MAKKKKKVNSAKRKAWLSGLQTAALTGVRFMARLLPIAILSALFFLGFIRVRDALYADPSLDVRQIQITPAGFLPAALKTELDKQWLGTNIFSADVRKVSSFLTKDPAVLKADTVKKFPSTLNVQITPRLPFARVSYAKGGPSAVISEDGMVLSLMDAKSEFNGPYLDAFESEWKVPVKGKRQAPKGLEQAVAFYHQFQYHPLAATENITRINLDYLGNLTLTLGTGPEVKLGRKPVELLNLLHKLDPIMADPAERSKVQYVDLQYEDVIVKKRTR